MKSRIIPMVVDKFDPLEKRRELVMANFDHDYCRGRDLDNPSLLFHFKLHNVNILLERRFIKN